jgi:hypothetical protein
LFVAHATWRPDPHFCFGAGQKLQLAAMLCDLFDAPPKLGFTCDKAIGPVKIGLCPGLHRLGQTPTAQHAQTMLGRHAEPGEVIDPCSELAFGGGYEDGGDRSRAHAALPKMGRATFLASSICSSAATPSRVAFV